MAKKSSRSIIEILIKKGVTFIDPNNVHIDPTVNPDRISGGQTIIYPGCRLSGESTLVLRKARLGSEGPVTVDNCQIGPGVQLKGGFFKDAVFLKDASMGFGAHVREGTILEEQAGGAHTVGLKQTILLPFVTLGSLINFCDCLMAGGTSRRNHSEVGSSYIHFNFTPNQDKATASLIGDIPRGVMLNRSPVFLGGQGGLVGPCRLAFGTIVAAGSICRRDELRSGRLIVENAKSNANMPFKTGRYTGINRIVSNNIVYIANLWALMQWYVHIRSLFISNDFPIALLAGLREKLQMGILERIKRLTAFMQKAGAGSDDRRNDTVCNTLSAFETGVTKSRFYAGDLRIRDNFITKIESVIQLEGMDYIDVIKKIDPLDAKNGTLWLQGIVDDIVKDFDF
ncbi:MAG: protein GlmU [Deltaproteobacteria bacterium]|nr:protein GlmU [Deltaproteobacteria bacterium]